MTEKILESQILCWLNLQPRVFAFKINTVGIYDPVKKVFRKNRNPFVIPGTADILGVAYGKFIAIEVKTPVSMKRWLNHPTSRDLLQKRFLERVERYGGYARCVCSLEQVKQFIDQLRIASAVTVPTS